MRKSKFFLLILALVTVLAFAVACGGDDPPAATPTPTPAAPAATPAPVDPVVPDEPATPEAPPAPAPIPRPHALVYSIATDPWIQQGSVGGVGLANVINEDNPYLSQAGNPTWNAIEGPNDTIALRFTNRTETWHALDVQVADLDLDLANNQYILTVTGNIQGGGTVTIGGADGPWATLAEQETDGDFTISLVITAATVSDAGSRGWLRVGSTCTATMEIYTLTVARHIERPEGLVYSLSTDPFVQALPNNTMGGGLVLATPNLSTAGGPTYGSTEGPFGMAIRMTNRAYNWNAVDIITESLDWDPENNTYLLTVHGHLAWGGAGIIGGADGPWMTFVEVETDDDNNFVATLEITAETIEDAGSRGWFRLQSDNNNDLTIFEVTIERQ